MDSKFLNMLGLAMNGKHLISGMDNVIRNIRRKKVYLVLISNDLSTESEKKISDKCNFYNVKLIKVNADQLTIGQALGKERRGIIGITNEGIKDYFLKLFYESGGEG